MQASTLLAQRAPRSRIAWIVRRAFSQAILQQAAVPVRLALLAMEVHQFAVTAQQAITAL